MASPQLGGWGGRYIYRQPYGETHPVWTQGGDLFTRVSSADTVRGADDKLYISDQATIWRWREAFQKDFAALMEWTIADFGHANHNPVAVVNGKAGTAPIFLDAEVGKPLTLDATGSSDPDHQQLEFHWFQYEEAGFGDGNLAGITISGADTATATVVPTKVCRDAWRADVACKGTGLAHVILEVQDDGTPQLTTYRRVVLTVHAGGRGKVAAT